MTKKRLASLGWIATATVVLLYVPMAAEYMFQFFGGGPRLWEHAYAQVVGEPQALGNGSIHADQGSSYAEQRRVMLAHTLVGSLAISLAILQISRRSRRRIAVHRWIGRVQVGLVLVSMPASMAFLVAVGPDHTFDGPPFYLQLWALGLGTTFGTLAGLVAIRAGHQSTHRIFMIYAFALLCTAPMLRVGYLLFGLAWRDSTQQVTNLAGAVVLAVFAPMAAVFASRFAPAPRRREHLKELPGSSLDRLVVGLGVVACVVLVLAYVSSFDGFDRITITAVLANALGIAVTYLNRRAAAAGVAAEDWRIHSLAMTAGLPLTALLWLVYSVPFTAEQAYYGALLTGPAVGLSAGLALVAWRRRRSPVVATSLVPPQERLLLDS